MITQEIINAVNQCAYDVCYQADQCAYCVVNPTNHQLLNIMKKKNKLLILGLLLTIIGVILAGSGLYPYNLPLNIVGGALIGWNLFQ